MVKGSPTAHRPTPMKHALRALLNAPEFTLVAAAIVAIGVGANTAVFSVVDATLLRPLPFKDSARLFMLSGVNAKRAMNGASFSYPQYVELVSRDRMLSGLAAVAPERFNATDGERPEQLPGARVSSSFFDVLDLDAAAGRTFAAAEDTAGAPPPAVIGRGYLGPRLRGPAGAPRGPPAPHRAPHTPLPAPRPPPPPPPGKHGVR